MPRTINLEELEKVLDIILSNGRNKNSLGDVQRKELIHEVATAIEASGISNENLKDPTIIKILSLALAATLANKLTNNRYDIFQINFRLLFKNKDRTLSAEEVETQKNELRHQIETMLYLINNGLLNPDEKILNLKPASNQIVEELLLPVAIYSGGKVIATEPRTGQRSLNMSVETLLASPTEEPEERYLEKTGVIKDRTGTPGMIANIMVELDEAEHTAQVRTANKDEEQKKMPNPFDVSKGPKFNPPDIISKL